MQTYLRPDDFPDVPNAAEVLDELEAFLSLRFPCLDTLDPDKGVLLKALLTPIVRRWGDTGGWVAGPFQKKANTAGRTLEAAEETSLRLLCGQPASTAAAPRGNFPAPEPIDDLFVRRPGWPRTNGRLL